MKLGDEMKVEVLLKLLEENSKQVEWLKELDFRIVYYAIVALLAGTVWVASNSSSIPELLFAGAVTVLSFLAILFLLRNHLRHAGLNKEFRKIAGALFLTKEKEYSEQAIYTLRERDDWTFHAGRGLYAIFVILVGIMAVFIVNYL